MASPLKNTFNSVKCSLSIPYLRRVRLFREQNASVLFTNKSANSTRIKIARPSFANYYAFSGNTNIDLYYVRSIEFGHIMLKGSRHRITISDQKDFKRKEKLILGALVLESNDSNYHLILQGAHSVFGFPLLNKSYVITEDSFITRSGIVFNSDYINKEIIKNKSANSLREILNTIKEEAELLGYERYSDKYGSFYFEQTFTSYSLMFEKWQLLIKKQVLLNKQKAHITEAKLIQNRQDIQSDLKPESLSIMPQEPLMKKISNNDASKYQVIIDEFNSYQYDLVKMMEKPILSDLNNEKVSNFYFLCKKFEENELEMNVLEFEMEWHKLINYSDIQRLNNYDSNQKKKLKDSKVMLEKAMNKESTDNEKAVSIKSLNLNLEGILPINDKVKEWIHINTGIKELT